MGIRFSAFAPCKYFFALAAVTEKVFSTITLTNYEYFAVAILVGKWVARSLWIWITFDSSSCNPRRQVGCQNGHEWRYSLRSSCNPRRQKVNKFNREMLQIVHFPFLCCQPNSS